MADYTKYTGGNAELDAFLEEQSKKYNASAAAGDSAGMQEANDTANQKRNELGYAAEYANEDIAAVAKQSASSASDSTSSGTSDYSDYINDLYSAQRTANEAELEAAYKNNVATLDAAKTEIAPYYQGVRNQAAATQAQSQNAWNEYAAANGLNSGTSGQAMLARQNVYGNALSTADTAEANAYSDLELQRTQLANEYKSAIASAQADGDYELAGALYQEMVRQQEAATATQQYQDSLVMQAAQQNRSVSDTEYNRRLQLAQTMAQYGDFSGYRAMGIDTTQMEKAYQAAQTTGTGSGTKANEKTLTLDQALSFISAGAFTTPALNTLYSYGFTDADIKSMNSAYNPDSAKGTVENTSNVDSVYSEALYRMGLKGASSNDIINYLSMMIAYGTITQQNAREIAQRLGLKI